MQRGLQWGHFVGDGSLAFVNKVFFTEGEAPTIGAMSSENTAAIVYEYKGDVFTPCMFNSC